MIRVKMLTLAAGPDGVRPVGSVHDVDADTAAALIEGGHAVPVDAPDVETAVAGPAETRKRRGN